MLWQERALVSSHEHPFKTAAPARNLLASIAVSSLTTIVFVVIVIMGTGVAPVPRAQATASEAIFKSSSSMKSFHSSRISSLISS